LFNAGKYGEALRRYMPLAEGGSIAAQLAVGWMHQAGRGVPTDLSEARFWYTRAAESGSVEALFYLAVLARADQRYEEAVKLLADCGQTYMPAIYLLGLMYDSGEGVKRDRRKARALYEAAAAMGHVFAEREIAERLMRGEDGLVNIPRGVYRMIRAVWTGFQIARRDPYSERIIAPEDLRWISR
jgi:TPR repeat protein